EFAVADFFGFAALAFEKQRGGEERDRQHDNHPGNAGPRPLRLGPLRYGPFGHGASARRLILHRLSPFETARDKPFILTHLRRKYDPPGERPSSARPTFFKSHHSRAMRPSDT